MRGEDFAQHRKRWNVPYIMSKASSEVWIFNKREVKKLEEAEMKFLRSLLRISRLEQEKTQILKIHK